MLETYLMEVIEKIENRQKENSAIGLNIFKIKKFDDSQFKLYLGDAALDTGIKKEDQQVYTTISEANGFDLVKKTYKNEFGDDIDWYFVFGGNNHEYNKFEILIFEITKSIDKIIINIDNDITTVYNVTEKYYSLITKYSMNEIIKIINENKLSIMINDETVKKNIIDVMKYQGIQPKFE